MKKNFAIQLDNVSKKYQLLHEKPTLIENISAKGRHEEFWALKNVSLNIKKGEKIGIMGPNGAGKTTLLEVIAGITTPSSGTVKTEGKVVSLIDLSAGMHPDLTGEENIYLNGMLIGMSKAEINTLKTKIIDFADIGNFIDSPLRTYSAGMQLRLGFSIAIHAGPDILVLDENLSVGDSNFQEKATSKVNGFFKENKTIIVVSHSSELINKICNRKIYINQGKIVKKYKE